jgi:hypothetical protein
MQVAVVPGRQQQEGLIMRASAGESVFFGTTWSSLHHALSHYAMRCSGCLGSNSLRKSKSKSKHGGGGGKGKSVHGTALFHSQPQCLSVPPQCLSQTVTFTVAVSHTVLYVGRLAIYST